MIYREKILTSACLIGQKSRYHGGDAFVSDPMLQRREDESRRVVLCPEVSTGFPVPRPPSEIENGAIGKALLADDAAVIKEDGLNDAKHLRKGARNALSVIDGILALENEIVRS